MVDKAYLLNPEDIRDFIVNGYIQIQDGFSDRPSRGHLSANRRDACERR